MRHREVSILSVAFAATLSGGCLYEHPVVGILPEDSESSDNSLALLGALGGIGWTARPTSVAESWSGISYGAGRFVGFGQLTANLTYADCD